MKKIFTLLLIVSILSFVSGAIYLEPWNTNQRGGNHNLSEMGTISANIFNGTLEGEVVGSMNWSLLKNFPTPCPGSSAVTTLNGSVVCSDLWVDSTGDNMTGDLNIDGNLNVTGNITSENVYLPAYLRIASNSTIAVPGVNNWTNVTFSKQAPQLKENIEHTWNDSTNKTITIIDAGVYEIFYTISIKDTSPLPDAHVGFRLMNDEIPIQGSYSEIDTSKQNEELFIHNSFITSFESGGTIHLQFISSDVDVSVIPHGVFQTSPSSAQISINKISN